MRLARIGWILWVAVILVAVVAAANQPPQGEDIALSTWEGTPVCFAVAATDPDIDCAAPTGHPLRFALVVPPSSGVVTGDFQDVLCSGKQASIALCYTPGGSFVGSDRFVIEVLDPFDERTSVAVSIEVRQPRDEGTLAGDVALTLTIDPLIPSFPSFTTDLALVYRHEGAAAEVRGTWKQTAGTTDDVFDDLKLLLRMPCSTVGSIAGRVDFDPSDSTPLFEFAEVRGELIVDPIWATATLHLGQLQTSSFTTLGLSGPLPMGGGSFSVMATLSNLCLCFEDATVRVRLPDLWCGLSGEATTTFAQTGFEQATLVLERIPVGMALAPAIGSSFDLIAAMEFAITASSVDAAIALEWIPPFVALDCVELLVDSVVSGGQWSGFQVYGLRIDEALSDEFSICSMTSLDPTDLAANARITGFVDYWEALILAGCFDLCGGIQGDWRAATYFGTTQTTLFDWGMTRFEFRARRSAEFELSSTIYFRSGDLGDPTVELVVGVLTHW
ncbi:hypothetical protein JW848_06925 [Candidatus Bipolaricaulota bacterium]|nr:hypothetical protein [Candidatus Bipolaricaulota bacterium]